MRLTALLLLPLLFSPAVAQESNSDGMPGMQHDHMHDSGSNKTAHAGESEIFFNDIVAHTTSGTSVEPDSTPVSMLMTMKGGWMLMFHANAFVAEEQQSSPRGGDKLFSTNWFMPMAQRELGRGTLTLRTMLSLEPATVTERQYPLLFQQGETAFGKPIVDGQHPHDFVMELAALYDFRLTDKTLLSFYVAPVGDPALGPVAYPHRASASENPLATLGHHQEDSTHISDDVITVGLTHGITRVEVSGFHGREPNEHRWQVQQGALDSWAVRLTLQPGRNWSAQYSYGRIASVEELYPNENQERMTASVMYNRKLARGNWATTAVWGRTRSLQDDSVFGSYLLESTLRFHQREAVWTRIESAERSNELLLGEAYLPANFQEKPIGRVEAFTFGYDHDFYFIPHLATALGGQVSVYHPGPQLQPVYGSDPAGVVVFLRLRPR